MHEITLYKSFLQLLLHPYAIHHGSTYDVVSMVISYTQLSFNDMGPKCFNWIPEGLKVIRSKGKVQSNIKKYLHSLLDEVVVSLIESGIIRLIFKYGNVIGS